MYLNNIKDTLFTEPLLGNEIVKTMSVKKIFHLMTGRNAWHSTWVRQFHKKSMATESGDLENDAEKKREAGTTFQIDEIPSLCLEFNSGCLLITEINTLYPLKEFNPKKLLMCMNQYNSNESSHKSIFDGENMLAILQRINQNEFWDSPRKESSLFQLFANNLRPSDFEGATQNYQTKISGTSGGKKNSLAWSIKIGKKSDEFLYKISML